MKTINKEIFKTMIAGALTIMTATIALSQSCYVSVPIPGSICNNSQAQCPSCQASVCTPLMATQCGDAQGGCGTSGCSNGTTSLSVKVTNYSTSNCSGSSGSCGAVLSSNTYPLGTVACAVPSGYACGDCGGS